MSYQECAAENCIGLVIKQSAVGRPRIYCCRQCNENASNMRRRHKTLKAKQAALEEQSAPLNTESA